MRKEHTEQDTRKVKEKMDAGLTREQAIQALERQAEYEAKRQPRKGTTTGGGDK